MGKQQGVIELHSLRVATALAPDVVTAREEDFRNPDTGLIVMCMHCRRTRSVAGPARWTFVSNWVERMPKNVSHGLCEPCGLHFYPG